MALKSYSLENLKNSPSNLILMGKKELVERAFQRGSLLTVKNPFYAKNLLSYFNYKYTNDVGRIGDITTDAILKNSGKVRAIIKAKQNGIISGIEEISFLYSKHGVKVKAMKKDGSQVKKGQVVAELYGNEKTLMTLERICMDLLQRMSGISTAASAMMKKIGKNTIAPTRKTELLYLDKKAVYDAGGYTHRLALWDAILIKENHLAIIKKEGHKKYIEEALRRAFLNAKNAKFIEVEVRNSKEAYSAAFYYNNSLKLINKKIPFIIMLDNFTPEKIRATIDLLKKKKMLDNVLIEVSGGINPKNVKAYAKTGTDMISIGYLTHSARALDLTQLVI